MYLLFVASCRNTKIIMAVYYMLCTAFMYESCDTCINAFKFAFFLEILAAFLKNRLINFTGHKGHPERQMFKGSGFALHESDTLVPLLQLRLGRNDADTG